MREATCDVMMGREGDEAMPLFPSFFSALLSIIGGHGHSLEFNLCREYATRCSAFCILLPVLQSRCSPRVEWPAARSRR